VFIRILGERTGLTPAGEREVLIEHVAIVAAIEHFTAMVGDWLLNANAVDDAGAHPVMLDLLRWHGAEEVEHRCVAFDLAAHLDPGYPRRVRSMAIAFPVLVWLWVRGARFLAAADTDGTAFRMTWRAAFAAARRGLLPAPGAVARRGLRYLSPSYHPSQDYSTRKAVEYLGYSPPPEPRSTSR
jgi:predicted metal-dependent hydrolase